MTRKLTKGQSAAVAIGGLALASWAARQARTRSYSFAGKVCLITGGSRGLGLVMARQICAEGGRVALLARDVDELRRAHDELAVGGADVAAIPCDLREREQIEEAVRTVVAHFGGIDVLINNAGIIEVGPLEHMKREDFERAMQLHLWAPFTMMREVIPHMRRRGGGRIVNISSIGGKVGVPHLAPYCASKFALVGLSDSMRSELAADNIFITTAAPGLMRTGSHVNAQFKGRHAEEFAWFAVANSMPGLSMKAERAAAKILDACRRGQPELTLTIAARAAIMGNAVFPNVTGRVLRLVGRLLPRATDSSGDTLRTGGESRSHKLTPEWLTRLADRATERNNESRRSGVH
jgi:NAD(P)-dependent dehydrogenase (short-subunit alcohol dehydrogenase family)